MSRDCEMSAILNNEGRALTARGGVKWATGGRGGAGPRMGRIGEHELIGVAHAKHPGWE